MASKGQGIVSGTVYDSSKLYTISDVNVYTTGGSFATSDSMGNYHINVKRGDSIYFYFQNRPTNKFPIKAITDYNQFDIALKVKVKDKYKPLKEVIVFSNGHRYDSLQNRQDYHDIFGYKKPGLYTTTPDMPGTAVGFDFDQIINLFRFKRNRQMHNFQERLLEEEQDNYVNYRFSPVLIKRITGLKGEALEHYRQQYRPTYQFVVNSGIVDFYDYILRTAAEYKSLNGLN